MILLNSHGQEDAVGHAFIRSTQVGLVGELLGAFVGVSLASIRLNLPIVLGGASMAILAVFLLLFVPENGFQPTFKSLDNSDQGEYASGR
jgi:MFS transporter, DHA3 family, tetracycline resistance protein